MRALRASSHGEPRLPAGSGPEHGRHARRIVDTGTGEHPRDDRVGVPHAACFQLVASPGGCGYARDQIQDSLRGGWVVRHANRSVDRRSQILQSGDSLDGEEVIPGFTMPVAELFAELNFD